MSAATIDRVTADGIGTVDITVSERGEGRTFLLLHGGGGPQTVTGWADQLAGARHARVLAPVHPGFDGTPRPEAVACTGALARLYVALLGQLELHDVTVVGNSIGGWIAAEMAVLGSDQVSSYVLVDAVGIEVPGHPVADFFSLTAEQVAQRSFYDPDAFGADPASLPPEAQAAMAAVRAALAVYAGAGMTDPTLTGRLAGVDAPVLVVWGEADGSATPTTAAPTPARSRTRSSGCSNTPVTCRNSKHPTRSSTRSGHLPTPIPPASPPANTGKNTQLGRITSEQP